jgi:lipopolysaccharide export LptBFGC system permease protein LptF
MKKVEVQELQRVIRHTLLALAIIWPLSFLGQADYLLRLARVFVFAEPFLAFFVAWVGCLPLVLPLVALAGICRSEAQFQGNREEQSILLMGEPLSRLFLIRLIPSFVLSITALFLQFWVMPMVWSTASSPRQVDTSEVLKILIQSPGRSPLPFQIRGIQEEGGGMSPFFLFGIPGKRALGVISQRAVARDVHHGGAIFRLFQGRAVFSEREAGQFQFSFSEGKIPLPLGRLRYHSEISPKGRSFYQLLKEAPFFGNERSKRLFFWEPWFRFLLGIAPTWMCLQAMLGLRRGLSPERSTLRSLGVFFLTLVFFLGPVIFTKSTAVKSLDFTCWVGFLGLSLPFLLNWIWAKCFP